MSGTNEATEATPPIKFRRVGTEAWKQAVDDFNAASESLYELETGHVGVVFLHPGREHAARISAFGKAGFALLQHPDRPQAADPEFIRLSAVLMGDRDPAWLEPWTATNRREAVQQATYGAAVRRRR
ncbi:MAG: hypothetical protein EON59_01645 [Alphaproteobacteria bacterium]|nr:MAG: hypothetical protein EON59_01645 [Alphaproteobacteria bacterium]